VSGLISLLGADRVCFGSDFPHPEGLDDPVAWVNQLDDIAPADIAKVMSSNMFGLMGLTAPAPSSAGH
jgi:predicted TIM-barrel fold metal-dependent hydrolase